MKSRVKMPKTVEIEVTVNGWLDYQTWKYTYRYMPTDGLWYRIETKYFCTAAAKSVASDLNPNGWVKVEID